MGAITLNPTVNTPGCSFSKFCYSGNEVPIPPGIGIALDIRPFGEEAHGFFPGPIFGIPPTGLGPVATVSYISTALNVTEWAGGTHTLKIWTSGGGGGKLILNEIHVCRVNESCVSQENLGSLIDIEKVWEGTLFFPHLFSITDVAAATSPALTDKISYVFVFTYTAIGPGGPIGAHMQFRGSFETPIEAPVCDLNPLNLSTDGFLASPLSMSVVGQLCFPTADVIPPAPPLPDNGGDSSKHRWRTKEGLRLQQEDDDILMVIVQSVDKLH